MRGVLERGSDPGTALVDTEKAIEYDPTTAWDT